MSAVPDRLQTALADRYTIERELGRGGMAVVYLAYDCRLDRRVAIKVLRADLTSVVAAERFLREIKLTASLAHPHILPLLDSGEADRLLYYVMPYVEGESLRERLDREGPLPVGEAVTIAREVADALSYAHERDLLHRDIKPENILLEAGHAVVADFGIARALSEAAGDRLTDTGVSIGTPAYMSPEQAAGERELSEASDLYSLACVLYEMLSGEPPVVDSTVQKIVSRKLLGEFRPLGEVCRGLPPEIAAAVTSALATDCVERFSSAGEFADALTTTIGVERDRRSERRWRPWARTRSSRFLTWRYAVLSLVLALAVGGAAAAGWLLIGGRMRRPVEATAIDPAHRIAILPFSYRGDEQYAYLGEGMVDLLSYSLDGVAEARTVTPRAVFSVLRQYDQDDPDGDRGAAIARHLHAARFVEGEIVESGGRLRISAHLVPVDADLGDVTAAMVEGEIEDGIGGLVDALSRQLLVGSEAGQLSQLGRVASMTTDSLEALKAFLEGVSSARVRQMRQAREALKRAVELDSTFALAWAALARASLDGGSRELSMEAAARAVRWSKRLPWRERQLVLGLDALITSDFGAAEGHYRDVVRRYPENVSAWLGLSSVFGFGHVRGRAWEEALEAARQAYLRSKEYEPDWWEPAMRYWWQVVQTGDSVLADSLFRGALSRWYVSRDSMPFNMRALEAFCIGDRVARDALVAEAKLSSAKGLLATTFAGACEVGVWQGAEIARSLANRAESGRVRAWAYLYAATYELALGHRRAARAEFDAARTIEPLWALQQETYWLLPSAFGAQRHELEAARDSLLAKDAPVVSPLAAPEAWVLNWATTVNDSIQPHVHLYLLGRLNARLGDHHAALEYADDVASLKAPLIHASASKDLAQAIRAFVLKEQGRYEEALPALEAAPRRVGYWNHNSIFALEPQERYLRAELLAELGRYDEALRWLRHIGYWIDEPLRAPAHLLSARIYERVGAVDSAAVHYKRFIDLWQDCDTELRPRVEAARRALEALSSGA